MPHAPGRGFCYVFLVNQGGARAMNQVILFCLEPIEGVDFCFGVELPPVCPLPSHSGPPAVLPPPRDLGGLCWGSGCHAGPHPLPCVPSALPL